MLPTKHERSCLGLTARMIRRLGAALVITCSASISAVQCRTSQLDYRQAAKAIDLGYARASADLRWHFWEGRVGRISPTQGNGGPQNGLVVGSQSATTFWQMAQFHKVLFGEWRIDHRVEAKAEIAANWRYIRQTYTMAQLSGDGRDDQSVSVSDDGGWKANFLAQVHSVTGDPEALHALEEMLPTITSRFLDPNQPRIFHGKSPTGRPFYSNPHGILYASDRDINSYRTYGRVSTLYEITLALAALYAYEHDGNPAYLSYARATFSWVYSDLRNIKESPLDAATGIYLCELKLDPADIRSGHLEAKNRYYTKPVRGLSAEYSGGTLAMAVLAARLYHLTRDPAYLSEARSIADSFTRLDAFGRQRRAVRLFVNDRDPWTDGYWYPDFVLEVLPLPGVDPSGNFKAALYSTASAIIAQRTKEGYYGADWSGPELDTADGVSTWREESHRANNGRGGGSAAPDQIMTSANSVLVMQAAHALVLLRHKMAVGDSAAGTSHQMTGQ